VGDSDLCTAAGSGRLLEVPVSVGFNCRNFERAQRIQRMAASRFLRPLHLNGILDRLSLVRRIKFSPEQSDAMQMKQLVRVCMANGAPVMVMMLHSSSLVPGLSPYVPDAGRLDRMFQDLSETWQYCKESHGMASATLTALARSFRVSPECVSAFAS
jgi:hypothetical protein